jgi:type IV pilus assembly protein PilW
MRTIKFLKYNFGYSLIELICALSLGALVLCSLVSVFSNAKRLSYDLIKQNEISEKVRIINWLLGNDLKPAGFSGCRRLKELALTDHTDFNFAFTNSIKGFDAKHLPNFLREKVFQESDVVVIQKADSGLEKILAPIVKNTAEIKVENNPATAYNLNLFISDCQNADLFLAKNYQGTTIVSSTNLAHDYDPQETTVTKFREVAYFLSDTGRIDSHNNKIISLYRVINRGNKTEIIEGVNYFKIKYGLYRENSDQIERYLAAAQFENTNWWEKVGGVLVTVSFNDDSKKYNFYFRLKERS